MVQVLRHLGLAARFVSGYLIQLKPDVKSLDGPSRHRGRLHRPARLVRGLSCPAPAGSGWTRHRACSPARATSRWPARPSRRTAAPVSGAVDECEVSVRAPRWAVTRIHESPRVTKPYTDEQWQAHRASSADQVDAHLQQQDVRLTMGGEPTFVSVDDRDGAEWNTDALGPTKRGFATELVRRLLREVRRRRLAALRPGQVVPRRATAALGADHRLARRRPAVLATTLRCSPTRRDTTRPHRRRRQGLHARADARASGWTRSHVQPALRGHLVLPVARAPAAGQRRSIRCQARRRTRARPACAASSRRGSTPPSAICCRCSACGPTRGRPALGQRPVVPARRTALPAARRFADGVAPAAGFAAVGRGR